jgi:hypothetical protein
MDERLARWGRPAEREDVGGSITDGQREAVRAAVAEALGDTYDCIRVWEAWRVGTMGPDDFVLVAEDDDRVAEIADAAIEALRSATPPAPDVEEGEELAEFLNALAAAPILTDHYAAQSRRAATLLQQQEARIAFLRHVLIDCGRAVGGLVDQSCSDSFLLDVATEVRLAVAKAAPAVVPVAVGKWDEGFMAGACAALAVVTLHYDSVIWSEIIRSVGIDDLLNHAANVNPQDWDLAGFSKYAQAELGRGKPYPLSQAGEVEA